MLNVSLRLGAALLLLGCLGNAAPSPLGEASAVIVYPKQLLTSDQIERVEPDNINAPLTEYAYDAEFAVSSRLAGPDLGQSARISYIDNRQWQRRKLFMIVHRDGRGRLWARRSWQEVGNHLCLSALQIATLDLGQAFARASDNAQGQRCIKI